MDIIKEISKELLPSVELPEFKSGDNITVYYRIKEGNKERIQFFKGDVLQRKDLDQQKHLLLEKYLTELQSKEFFL